MKRVNALVAVVLAMGLMAGCGSTSKDGAGAAGGLDGAGGSGMGRLGGGASDLSGAGGAGGAGDAAMEENRVYFDYDSAIVTEQGKQNLLLSARKIMAQPTGKVTVEGHCDERGTREYNLALGQKRADAAKHILVTQGVPANRIQTISYGKERALVGGHDEFAGSKNRRAEVIIH